jgi:D-cysteine desulfhydrase
MNSDELLQQLAKLAPLALGQLPTPLHPLPGLSAYLQGPEIWIKRDDLSGLGMGGNKVRKLAFLLAEALRSEADVVMTTGAQQSNHARQTAAAAARLGLPCVLVLAGEAPTAPPAGNYLLDRLFGAEVRWAGERDPMAALTAEAEALRETGRHPYVIPYGGSNAVGVCGFVAAMVELSQQATAQELAFTDIVLASSSGGTQAGLALGAHLLEYPARIVGISIAEQAEALRDQLGNLTSATANLLELPASLTPEDFTVTAAYLGAGYGIVGDLERAALQLMARTEGLPVDPVYTGRALGALVDLVRQGTFTAEERILFWHTGGSPALFAYGEELGV